MAAVESKTQDLPSKNKFECRNCEKERDNADLFLWSNCGHKYCRECAFNFTIKQIFEQTYPQCIAILNDEVKSEIKNNDDDDDDDDNNNTNESKDNRCHEPLANSDATLILPEEYYDAFLVLYNAKQEHENALAKQEKEQEMKRNDNDSKDNNIIEEKIDEQKLEQDRKKIKYNKFKEFICDYCSHGTKVHEIESRFYWSQCKHEFSQECAVSVILDQLLNSKLPLCPINNCSKILREDEASIVLDIDFYVIYSQLYRNYLVAHGLIPDIPPPPNNPPPKEALLQPPDPLANAQGRSYLLEQQQQQQQQQEQQAAQQKNNNKNINNNGNNDKKQQANGVGVDDNNDGQIDMNLLNEIMNVPDTDNNNNNNNMNNYNRFDDFYDARIEDEEFYCSNCHKVYKTMIEGKIQKIKFTNMNCGHVACIACARKHIEREIVTFKKLPTCVVCLKNINELDLNNLFPPRLCKQLTDHLFKEASLVVPPFRPQQIAGAGDKVNKKNQFRRQPVVYFYEDNSDYPSVQKPNNRVDKNGMNINPMWGSDPNAIESKQSNDNHNNNNMNKNNNGMGYNDQMTVMANVGVDEHKHDNNNNNNNEINGAHNMVAHANTAEITQRMMMEQQKEYNDDKKNNGNNKPQELVNVVPPPLEEDNTYIANELDVNSDNPYVRAQLDDANVMLRIQDEQEAMRQKAKERLENQKNNGNDENEDDNETENGVELKENTGNGNGNGNEEENENGDDSDGCYRICLTESCNKRVKLPSSDHTQLDCPNCGISWCLKCGVEYHAFLTCEDYQASVTQALLKEEQELQMQQTQQIQELAQAQTQAQMGNLLDGMPFIDDGDNNGINDGIFNNNNNNGNNNGNGQGLLSDEEFGALFGDMGNDSNVNNNNNNNNYNVNENENKNKNDDNNNNNKKKKENENENEIIFQHCPNCDTPIEKIGGCNNVTCLACGTPFCFICGSKLDPNNLESHFDDNNHPLWTKKPLDDNAIKQAENEIRQRDIKAEMQRSNQNQNQKQKQQQKQNNGNKNDNKNKNKKNNKNNNNGKNNNNRNRRNTRRRDDSDDEAAPIVGVGRWH